MKPCWHRATSGYDNLVRLFDISSVNSDSGPVLLRHYVHTQDL
jgi:hypothetical protein